MTTYTIKPWTDVVNLHPDVAAGTLTEAMFAIDLGAIADRDPNVPLVNREPEAFFRATYLTTDLRKLLDEVLASLAGRPGYNRVLKLRSPFGGGKSHTMATLLHAARDRQALNVIPEGRGFADPGAVRVAVFDGEKFDARVGKTLPDGRIIRTMWGWLAWQLGEEAYQTVAEHDADRVSPGGDVIKLMLAGAPTLFLLDEVVKYLERAAGVEVRESNLQRQALDFIQNLTVEVSGSTNAVMVYSLQSSIRQAMGNVVLLQTVDTLTNRVDQLREPVTGDEVMYILHRRLLSGDPHDDTAQEVSQRYSETVTAMERAEAENLIARQQAEEDGLALATRMRKAYPFHPALIDLMTERWAAVDAFQRTRGALRFLAACLQGIKQDGGARAALGPGDVPVGNAGARLAMVKELGLQNEYDPVLNADIVGPNSRARKIDEKLARETPALDNVKPALRLATAILMYSFGGLRRDTGHGEETLPPGVTETELLAATVGPDLDNITAKAVLAELRTRCLFLHYDGVRYCFKKDPNVTKLIEDTEQEVAKDQALVNQRIKEMLNSRLAGKAGAIIWPNTPLDIPDGEPRFLIGYLPLAFAAKAPSEQTQSAVDYCTRYGDRPRRYRNGLGLAIPDKRQVEPLRRAVRYLLAIERVKLKKDQLRLSKDQLDQLKERQGTEEGAAESAIRALYSAVWLPRVEDGTIGIDPIDGTSRALQATGIHERVMEMLTAMGVQRVFGSVTPSKVASRVKLGEVLREGEAPRLGVTAKEARDAFFEFLEPPRIDSDTVVRKAIVRGVQEGAFAYFSGPLPVLGEDGVYQISREKVAFQRSIAEDEVDFDTGFLMISSAIPALPIIVATPTPPTGAGAIHEGDTPGGGTIGDPRPSGGTPDAGATGTAVTNSIRLRFQATRKQLYAAFQALANLADRSNEGQITVTIEGVADAGYDKTWIRNAVEEPLDEADIERR